MPLNPAYVAGILDGEGCISVARRGRYITPTVQVSNTNFEILFALKADFGGNIYINKDKRPTRKLIGLWSVAGDKARNVVAFASQFLIIKKSQALLIASLPKRANGTRLTPHDFSINEEFIVKFRALNRRGAL